MGMGGWALWGCLGRGLWFLMVLEGGEMGQETGETAEKSTTYESTETRELFDDSNDLFICKTTRIVKKRTTDGGRLSIRIQVFMETRHKTSTSSIRCDFI